MPTCCYCGATKGTFVIDHVVPRSRGGPDGPRNCVVACTDCNISKGDLLPSEWRKRLPPLVKGIEKRVCRSIAVSQRRRRGCAPGKRRPRPNRPSGAISIEIWDWLVRQFSIDPRGPYDCDVWVFCLKRGLDREEVWSAVCEIASLMDIHEFRRTASLLAIVRAVRRARREARINLRMSQNR